MGEKTLRSPVPLGGLLDEVTGGARGNEFEAGAAGAGDVLDGRLIYLVFDTADHFGTGVFRKRSAGEEFITGRGQELTYVNEQRDVPIALGNVHQIVTALYRVEAFSGLRTVRTSGVKVDRHDNNTVVTIRRVGIHYRYNIGFENCRTVAVALQGVIDNRLDFGFRRGITSYSAYFFIGAGDKAHYRFLFGSTTFAGADSVFHDIRYFFDGLYRGEHVRKSY